MKKLIHIPNKVWVFMFIVLMACVAFIYFLLNYQVETTIKTSIHSKGTTQSVYVNADTAYKVKELSTIHIRIGNKTFDTVIKEIIYDKESGMYQLKLSGLSVTLLPNSALQGVIVIGKHSVGSFLFGSV